MNTIAEEALISKIKTLSPQQVAEVEDFVEFLATKAARRARVYGLIFTSSPRTRRRGGAKATAAFSRMRTVAFSYSR